MRNFFIALVGIAIMGSIGLMGCGKKKPEDPKPPATDSLPEPLGKSPQEAAEKGLAILKDMSKKPESYAVGGFESPEEAPLAKLGPAFMTYSIGCPALSPADLAKPLTDLVTRSQVTHTVQVKDEARSLIYVDSLNGDAKASEQGHWAVTAMGDAPIIHLFDSAAAYFGQAQGRRESDVLIHLPGAQTHLRATGLKEEDLVYPLSHDQALPCLGVVKEPIPWSALRKGLSTCQSTLDFCSQKPIQPPASDSAAQKK